MRLILGDCIEQLKTLEPNSVDAVVTDPPYGLSFMGKRWDYDVPSAEVWREVLRVLKPGGHLLSFGGTRTYHRMVVQVEDAGFEIRDQVQWIYGSGFPKSLNVGLAIDKQAGAIQARAKGFNTAGGKENFEAQDKSFRSDDGHVTEYKTDDARTWAGWGTALKPANEPIVLARKPLEKGLTVAENVLKWGTGAINVDAGRIVTTGADREKHLAEWNRQQSTAKGVANYVGQKDIALNDYAKEGRWPANVLFDESAAEMLDAQSGVSKSSKLNTVQQAREPQSKGAERVRVDEGFNDSGGASRFFFVVKEEKQWQDQRDSNLVKHAANNFSYDEAHLNSVLEAVRTNFKNDHQLLHSLDSIPDYKKCILLQNLALLAESPENIGIIEITQSLLKLFGSVHHVIDENTNSESQNASNVPTRFLYQAKASKRERNAGLEGMPERMVYHENGDINGVGGLCVNSNPRCLTCGKEKFHRVNVGKCECAEPNWKLSESKPSQNFHPTVKPIKLMEYLIKLITPPGGTVLDPFMGSGSTGVAAKRLGFEFIGVEMNSDYLEIAKRRIG